MHYCTSIKDEEDRTTGYQIDTNLPKPTNEEARKLLRDQGNFLSDDDLEKFKDAHNNRIAQTLAPAPINPIFAYPYVITAKGETIDFKDTRQHFYTAAASIPGKVRHENFTVSIIGRMPTEWME